MLDFIIVGQGIAGSVLALQLLQRHQRILVIDEEHSQSASNAAAGIYNPITGRAMVKTWLAKDLFPYLTCFYQASETILGAKFLYPTPIFRPFLTVQERFEWLERINTGDYADFVTNVAGPAYHRTRMVYQHGGIVLKQSGYLDVKCFLRATRAYLKSRNAYIATKFLHSQLHIDHHVRYFGTIARKIIFCEGSQASGNFFFPRLPFRLVKGELLLVELEEPLKVIYSRHVFVLPRTHKQAVVGATYDEKDLSSEPTKASRQLLEERLRSIFRLDYVVHKHWTGIRPATFDRRPLIGLHPQYPQLCIFNGLGAKGVSLAPYFARSLVEHLLLEKELPLAVQVRRTELLQRSQHSRLAVSHKNA